MEKDSRWWVTALSSGLVGFEGEGRAARSISQSSGSTAREDAAYEKKTGMMGHILSVICYLSDHSITRAGA